jgi:hypothetical protein
VLRREEKRLSVVFGRALVLALATPACGSERYNPADAGATDATVVPDGATDGGTPAEAGDGGGACARTTYDPTIMDLCADFWRMPCGLPDASPRANCFLSLEDCNRVCDGFFYNCFTIDESCVDGSVVNDSDGGLAIECSWCIGGPGRAPAGLSPERFSSSLGGWFARAAHFEAASVHAFRRLQRELRALGAPKSLIRAARRAESDEIRHARVTRRFAKRLGARTVRPRVRTVPRRSMEAIAIENAVQGCVGETYAALEALWQAEAAPTAELRNVMRAIARDETRHAALAWAIAGWLEPRLSAAARLRAHRARSAAARDLARQPPPLPAVLRGAGLPNDEARRVLLSELGRALEW